MNENDPLLRWLEKQRAEQELTQETLNDFLRDFDPDWKMQSGDHLSDYDYDFLQSCNVSWEYNNKEEKE